MTAMLPEEVTEALVAPISQDGLAGQAYQRVREAILAGRLRPGQQITSRELASQLRVSFTPIRDALKRLESDGLVEIVQRRGVFVTAVTRARVSETFQIRRIIESAAVEQPGRGGGESLGRMRSHLMEMESLREGATYSDYLRYVELDARFHSEIVARLHNERLQEIYQGLRWTTQLCLVLYRSSDRRAAGTYAEHAAILDALAAGERGLARKAVVTHLRNAERALLEHVPARD